MLEASLLGRPWRFHTTWGLFSPKRVDEGSTLLIESIKVEKDARILDVGCGYGPIGLALASCASDGLTHLVDKDFVAVEYAQKNATENNVNNVRVYLSNGLKHVEENDFDWVVSNLPAKVGNELLSIIIEDACSKLRIGGSLAVVTISGLRNHIRREFERVFGNYTKVKQGKTYTVSQATRKR